MAYKVKGQHRPGIMGATLQAVASAMTLPHPHRVDALLRAAEHHPTLGEFPAFQGLVLAAVGGGVDCGFRKLFTPLTAAEGTTVDSFVSTQNIGADEDDERPIADVYYYAGAQGDAVVLRAKHISRLVHGGWLHDEVINMALHCFQNAHNRVRDVYPEMAPVYAFHSFFMEKLMRGEPVGRWSKLLKPITGGQVLRLGKLIIPVNHGLCHWSFLVADFVRHVITHYDSLRRSGGRHGRLLASYLSQEEELAGAPREEWALEESGDSPEQHNGFDCGVFMLSGAHCIFHGQEVAFDGSSCPVVRRQLMLLLLSRGL